LESNGRVLIVPDVGAVALPSLKAALLQFDSVECLAAYTNIEELLESSHDLAVLYRHGKLNFLQLGQVLPEDLSMKESMEFAFEAAESVPSVRQMRKTYEQVLSTLDGTFVSLILRKTVAHLEEKENLREVASSPKCRLLLRQLE
jgi:hypothetical protein